MQTKSEIFDIATVTRGERIQGGWLETGGKKENEPTRCQSDQMAKHQGRDETGPYAHHKARLRREEKKRSERVPSSRRWLHCDLNGSQEGVPMMTYPQWLLDIPDNLAPRRDGMCRVEAAKYGLGCDDLKIEVFCPGGESLVKSQSPQKKRELEEIGYPVTLQPLPHCTCRDFEHWARLEPGRACKHILAVVLRLTHQA